MEGGFTCTAASQSTKIPLCLSHHRLVNRQFSLPITVSTDGNTKSATKRRRAICVKALENSSTASRPLSSDWDVASLSSFTFPDSIRMPRFEDLDVTNVLLRQRIVFLGTRVEAESADFIINQLLFLDAEDSERDIKLLINSSGGSVVAAMAIYDAMKLCKADVSTVCFGLSASMSAFLLAAGTKGKRYCMPNGRIMLHQPVGEETQGTPTKHLIERRELNYHRIKVNKLLSRFTGKPVEQINVDTVQDNFMNAWEAKEYGLVDAVIDDGKSGLVAPRVDCSPPPKVRLLDFLKVYESGEEKNLPSEHMFLQNGLIGGE